MIFNYSMTFYNYDNTEAVNQVILCSWVCGIQVSYLPVCFHDRVITISNKQDRPQRMFQEPVRHALLEPVLFKYRTSAI